jgi:hypothetical protein
LPHDRRRASDEGIEERFEARERTDVEAARRDEAREVLVETARRLWSWEGVARGVLAASRGELDRLPLA